ncbi:MAG: hypothetical protein Ct9H300mP7_2500 [Verrucomicrobiota bacterium]|nr:MAG: hypothetical protein Ct9H300mP7_2500 [Verrucomicrobiota bacterium]
MTTEELKQLKGGGRHGFFSYAMNIDLKRGTVNLYMPYPKMPKATDLFNPSATVGTMDMYFSSSEGLGETLLLGEPGSKMAGVSRGAKATGGRAGVHRRTFGLFLAALHNQRRGHI